MPRLPLTLLFRAILLLCLLAPLARSQSSAVADAQVRLQRGRTLADAGKSDEARKIYEPLAAELRGRGPSLELADTLSGLTDLANLAGDYDKALAISREAVEVCRKLNDPACEARARNDVGLAESNSGNYSAAASDLESALALSRQGNQASTAVMVLNNLGNVFYYQARYSEALRSYESAASDIEKHSSEYWTISWRPVTRVNLATLYQRVGNDRRALEIYIQASNDPVGLSYREIAHLLANIGILYRRLGDAENALKNYHDAERWYAKQQDVDGEIGVLKNIGIVLALDEGKLKDALPTFDKALQLATKTGNQREAMQAQLYRGETLYRLDRLPDATRAFASALSSATQLGTVEEQWKAIYALGRIAERNGDLTGAEDKYRAAISKIESLRSKLQLNRLKSDFLADKRDVYDALIKLLLGRNDAAGLFEFMERSRSRSFQDRFFAGKVDPGSLSLASIRNRLPHQTAMVEFWTGPDAVAAVWVTREGQGIAQKHFSPRELEGFQQSVSGLPDNLGSDWRSAFDRISAWVPSGIAPLGDSRYRHLLIVPDGFLSMFPFELMPISGGPVIELHDVTYMPSAVLLLRGAVPRNVGLGWPWQSQLVAFGDPTVVGKGESSLVASVREGGPGSLGALPNSRVEIKGIAKMTAGEAKLFLGNQDQKTHFFNVSRSRASILHVSTHAVADMDNPERSRLLFSPDAAGQPNNFLFLKELYDESLDLRGVSLATLSACDTERGKLVPGEGVQAFSRALLAAGSRSSLTTLWRVPDQPTSEFMQEFYYHLLKEHTSKAEALRLTKLEFLRSKGELSHPKYWAAFVLNGDGNAPVPRFVPWQLLLLPILLLVAIGIIAWQLRARVWSKKEVARPVSV